MLLSLTKPATHVQVTLLPTFEHVALPPQPPLLAEHTGTQVLVLLSLTKPEMHVQLMLPPAPSEHVALPPQPPLLTVHWLTHGSAPLTLV